MTVNRVAADQHNMRVGAARSTFYTLASSTTNVLTATSTPSTVIAPLNREMPSSCAIRGSVKLFYADNCTST